MTPKALEILLILILRLSFLSPDPCQNITSLTTIDIHEALDPNSSRLNPDILTIARGTYGTKTVEIAIHEEELVYVYIWNGTAWVHKSLTSYWKNMRARAETEVEVGVPAYCEGDLTFYRKPRSKP